MDSFEKLTPDLLKGKLLSDIGGTALIYDGVFQGSPVVIKEARNYLTTPIIQQEHDFLLNPPEPIYHKLLDYGIPTDWNIRTRFVGLVPEAVTQPMYDRGITVLEKVNGKALVNSDEATNFQVPLKFQLFYSSDSKEGITLKHNSKVMQHCNDLKNKDFITTIK